MAELTTAATALIWVFTIAELIGLVFAGAIVWWIWRQFRK